MISTISDKSYFKWGGQKIFKLFSFTAKILTAVFLAICFTSSALCQSIVIHTGSGEDGDPEFDADGTVNGVIVWNPGKIHVVSGDYYITNNRTLKINDGAIVKCARNVVTDTLGNITDWDPNGFIQVTEGSLQIDGATITDIRDDEVGGDTNRDGGASQPAVSNTEGILIRFGKTGDDLLTNSTIKYLNQMLIRNSMDVQFNTFNKFYYIGSFFEVEPNSTPDISNNTFILYNNSQIDLRGLAPIVNGNSFSYTDDPVVLGGSIPTLLVGPLSYDGNNGITPLNGRIIISNNRFNTASAIEFGYGQYNDSTPESDSKFAHYTIHASVYDNEFIGTVKGNPNASGSFGIRIPVVSDISINRNNFSNFNENIRLADSPGQTASEVHINQNRFFFNNSGGGGSMIRTRFAEETFYVDATNNYWGNATGPRDAYEDDGISNPNGTGVGVAKYVWYIPFIGGTTPPGKDIIQISSETINPLPGLPLLPEVPAEVKVTVQKFKLASSNTGKVIVYVRDDGGIIHNLPGTQVSVNSQNTTFDIPSVIFTPPLGTSNMWIEAVIIPDGNNPSTTSNINKLKVEQPESKIQILKVEKTPYEPFYNGVNYDVKFFIKYTYAGAGNGSIEIKTRRFESNQLVEEFPVITQAAPPAVNGTIEKQFFISLPLKEHLHEKNYDLRFNVVLKDDAGNKISECYAEYSIKESFPKKIFVLKPAHDAGGYIEETGRDFFVAGDKVVLSVDAQLDLKSQNLDNVQIRLRAINYYTSGSTPPFQEFFTQVVCDNVETGSQNYHFNIITDSVIPQGVKYIYIDLDFFAPSQNIEIGQYFFGEVLVVSNIAKSAQRTASAGSSVLDFSPLPVSLNLSSNDAERMVTAGEINSQYASTENNLKKIMNNDPMYTYWEFFPINRYWIIYSNPSTGNMRGEISIIYDPASDFPSSAQFNEDSLVIAAFNPNSGALEALSTTVDKFNHKLTAAYSNFYQIWVPASKKTNIVSEINKENEIPSKYALMQNYPNPFNPDTKIKYQLSSNAFVKLVVYDILGQEVETLVNKEQKPGYYSIEFNASSLASGVYFYRIQTKDFCDVKKMLMIK